MRIVSWNMNHWQQADEAARERGWRYLRQELQADVALLQEAVAPLDCDAVARPGGIAGRDGKSRRWGSAVVSLTAAHPLTAVGLAEGQWRGRSLGVAPLDCVSRGHVAVALCPTPVGQLTVISAYGLIEFGYASGTMLRTIADLEPLFDDPDLGANVLIAGDWNIGTWWTGPDQKYAAREAALLELLGAYGLVDALDPHLPPDRGPLESCPCQQPSCRHISTHRKPNQPHAYQDDYLYISAHLLGHIDSAGVAADWDWDSGLSDHAPLYCDLGTREPKPASSEGA